MDTANAILLVVGILGFLLQAGVVVAGAIWAVGQIKAAGATLQATIDHHSQIIQKLEATMTSLNERVTVHGEGIARLQEQVRS